MTAPTHVAGLGVNVSRPGATSSPATATKADERSTLTAAKTLPAPSPTHLAAGTVVRVVGGPYLRQHGLIGHVLHDPPGPYLRVRVDAPCEGFATLHLTRNEVDPL